VSVRVISVSGTHYEMGQQHGLQVRALRPLIVKAIEAQFHQIEQHGPDERFESLLRETRELLQRIDRPIVEMIRGQAWGLGLPFETLLRYGLATYLPFPSSPFPSPLSILPLSPFHPGEESCTTWAASGPATADGTPILAKNRDSSPEHLPLQVVVRANPEDGYRYAYVTSAGSPGVFCAGMNEAGLAVADTHVCSTDIGPGLPDYALMMHILEEQNSVRGALAYLRSVTRLGRNNLILADAGGDLAVFEIGHRTYGLVVPEDHILVSTNHFVSPQLRQQWVESPSHLYCTASPSTVSLGPGTKGEKPHLQGNSQRRREVVRAALIEARGRIDVAWAQALMARHGGPLDSLCRHEELGGRSVTISSTIFLPAARNLWTCFGYPCRCLLVIARSAATKQSLPYPVRRRLLRPRGARNDSGGYRLFSVLVLSSRRHIEGKEDEE
jgi:isopenicillin-N N-acyltransferase-like protein